jgi:hypothetical protein
MEIEGIVYSKHRELVDEEHQQGRGSCTIMLRLQKGEIYSDHFHIHRLSLNK